MTSRLLPRIKITQRATVIKRLAGENEALLVGSDALLVLNLALDVRNRDASLNFECDRLARQSWGKGKVPSTPAVTLIQKTVSGVWYVEPTHT